MLFYILKDVVRLRILRERVYPGLFRRALNATTSVYMRKAMGDFHTDMHKREANVKIKEEVGVMKL